MRLYRFMNAENGLRSLRERRLRIGRIEELNDDFECICLALSEKADRLALREMRKHIHEKTGVVCMSRRRDSPLMWAHYADSHKGMALGFDVPKFVVHQVDYVETRPKLTDLGIDSLDDITPDQIKDLLRMKAAGWSYEQEYRAFQPLENGVSINGETHYFVPFNERLRLREVMVGTRFEGQRRDVVSIVDDPNVEIFMARGSFADFRVVRQQNAGLWH